MNKEPEEMTDDELRKRREQLISDLDDAELELDGVAEEFRKQLHLHLQSLTQEQAKEK
jgi:hypothetical protein